MSEKPSVETGECQVGANCHDEATHFIMVKRPSSAQRLELCAQHYHLALDMREAHLASLGTHGPLSEEDKLIMKDHRLPIEVRREAFKRHNRRQARR